MSPKQIVFVTGLSASGKSFIAKQLATDTGFVLFSVGNFQRAFAKSQGYSDVTEFNRKVGLQKAYFELLPSILREINSLIQKNNGVIIEGLYSKSLMDHVKESFPTATVKLFNVGLSRHKRSTRYAEREELNLKIAKNKMRRLDNNKRAIGFQEVQQLRGPGIHTIRNNGTPNQAIEAIKRHLRR